VTAPESLALVGVAAAAFAATNVDDLLLLGLFFADRTRSPRAVVAGQFLGIGALFGASALCSLAALVVPPAWVALLGVAPLALGCAALFDRWRRARRREAADTTDATDAVPASTTRGQVLAVALVTIANGGDNLAVYVPLFARHPGELATFGVVFAAGTALWCLLGTVLARRAAVSSRVRALGAALLPWVLIVLGLHVLAGAAPLLQ